MTFLKFVEVDFHENTIIKKNAHFFLKIALKYKNYGPEVETVKPRETREDRWLGLGRGGVELFKPRGVIGRGPYGPWIDKAGRSWT